MHAVVDRYYQVQVYDKQLKSWHYVGHAQDELVRTIELMRSVSPQRAKVRVIAHEIHASVVCERGDTTLEPTERAICRDCGCSWLEPSGARAARIPGVLKQCPLCHSTGIDNEMAFV